MKSYAIAMLGSLAMFAMGCNIDVDECGGDDWDDDDDDQPCETTTVSSTVSGGSDVSGGVGGSHASGGSGGSDASGGSGGSGASGGSGGSDASGGSGGSDDDDDSDVSGDSGGSDASGGSGGSDASGGSGGSDTDTSTGAGGACDDCNPLPDGENCLWGSTKMDSCCSVDVLVDVGAAECQSYGLSLSDFVLQDACSGGHQQVDYQCCREELSGCSTQEVSLEACVSEDVLSALADEVCADLGQEVSSHQASQACGTDSYQGVEVTCCVMDVE